MAMRERQPAAVPDAPAVHVVEANAVYLVEDAIRLFRLKKSTIRREIREGRLRVSKRAGRHYLLGEWLLEWFRAGELPRRSGRRNGDGRGP
jgi:hypothetical protein